MPTKKRRPKAAPKKRTTAKKAPRKAAPKKRAAKAAPKAKKRVNKWIGPALGVKKRHVGMGPHHRKAVRVEGAHKNALHKQLGVPVGEKIPVSLLHKVEHAPGKLGQRARFALTVRKFKHPKKGK